MHPHHGLPSRRIQDLADVEYATAGWVDWYNHARLHGSLGLVTPIEYEQAHYAALNPIGSTT
jgi:putative transposase